MTGGVRGIGLETARLFAREGYAVSVCYAGDEASAEAARAEGFRAVRADVSDEGDVRRLFDEIGPVDVLVNNAGISLFGLLQDTEAKDWDRVFAVNVRGAFLCSRAAIPYMLRKGGGAIVNVSSVWGVAGASCEVAYSASKAALIGFTKALAKELAPSGIRVNCVAPGVIETSMNARFSEEEMEAITGDIPLGRVGSPSEVAQAIWALCCNGYVTGQVLGVDGGFGR